MLCKATRLWITTSRRCIRVLSSEKRRSKSKLSTSRYLDTSSTTQVAKNSGRTWKTLWFLFLRNLYGHPLAASLGQRQFEKVLFGRGWENVPSWECLFVHRTQGLFLSVYVEDSEMAGRKHNMALMWKKLMKFVDLGESTSFLDHVHVGCSQRECKSTEIVGKMQRNVRFTIFCWSN